MHEPRQEIDDDRVYPFDVITYVRFRILNVYDDLLHCFSYDVLSLTGEKQEENMAFSAVSNLNPS